MFKQVTSYVKEIYNSAKYLLEGFSVTLSHMGRRPVTVQYPYEKLIPSERYRGRIHYEFDKCIACEVCVRVCPINLPVVDWVMNKETKKKGFFSLFKFKVEKYPRFRKPEIHFSTISWRFNGLN